MSECLSPVERDAVAAFKPIERRPEKTIIGLRR